MRIFSLFILFFCPLSIYAQDSLTVPERFVIQSISIKGNEKTQEDIILNELTFLTGDTVSIEAIRFNRERIFSLGLFSRVEMKLSDTAENKHLQITVSEMWYIWLYPTLEINDRDFNKLSYGFFLSVDNLRGRNESFRLGAALGYNPKLYFRYTMPYLFTRDEILGEISGFWGKEKNLSKLATIQNGGDFENQVIRGNLTISKRFQKFHYLQFSTSFNHLSVPEGKKYRTLSGFTTDRLLSHSFGILRDSRDLKQFPVSGSYFNLFYKFSWLVSGSDNFSQVGLEFKKYIPINEWNIKFRLAGRSLIGPVIPTYELNYLGYSERNRGHYSRIEQGELMISNQVELRYPLIKEFNYEIPFEFIPESIRKYRTAIYFQVFSDQHLVKSKLSEWKNTNVLSGYGMGFTFLILPYNALRIEYGFSETGTGNLVIDVGISF